MQECALRKVTLTLSSSAAGQPIGLRRRRYAEKDELLERFFQTGSFSPVRQTQAVQLRSATEILLPYVVAAVQLLIYYILWSSVRAVVGPYWPW